MKLSLQGFLFYLLFFSVFWLNCVNNTEEHTLSFSTSVFPDGSGQVTPQEGNLFPLDSVALFAYPNLGYTFSHWNSDTTDSVIPRNFVLDTDSTITGNFALDDFPKAFGGAGRDTPTMFLTKDDALFMLGPFRSNDGDFAGLNKGLQDFFIARYDNDNGLKVLGGYGGSILDDATDFYINANNEFVVTGWARSDDGDFPSNRFNRSDIFVARINQQGAIVWKTTLGGFETDASTQIMPFENGYLMSGITASKDGFLGISDTLKTGVAFILKMSLQGDIEWVELFDGPEEDVIDHLQVLSDGSIIATGKTSSKTEFFEHAGTFPLRLYTFKLSPSREVEWIIFHKDTKRTDIRDTYLLNDQEMLLAGDVFDPAISDEIYVVKLALDTGDIIWENTYGGTSSDNAFAMDVDNRGNIFVAGPSASLDGIFSGATGNFINNPEAFIIKLDPLGNYESTFLLDGNQTDFMVDIAIEEPLIFYYGHTRSNAGDFNFRSSSNITDIFFGAVELSEFEQQ